MSRLPKLAQRSLRLRPALGQRLRPLNAWWLARDARERRTLRWAAGLLLPVILVFGLWLPLSERVRKLEARVADGRAQVAEMRGMQAWWRSRPGMGAHAALPVDLAARLEGDLRAAQPAFKGSVRASEDGIELLLEAASFDALLPWLAQVARRDGLFPREVQLVAVTTPSPAAGAGLVAGRVRLQAASE